MVLLLRNFLFTNASGTPRFISGKSAALFLGVSPKQFRRLVKIMPFNPIPFPRAQQRGWDSNGVIHLYLREEIENGKERALTLIEQKKLD